MSRQRPHKVMRYEHRSQEVLPRPLFIKRIMTHVLLAAAVVGLSLAIGVLGYHYFASLSWIDSFLNASMILAGMGPVADLPGDSGKLFASFYALYSGVAFLAIASILVAPFAHRLLHLLHLDENDSPKA